MPKRPLIENPNDIRLNDQDEVQNLLGQTPGWMLRWGIPFVGMGALILILISAWVSYPDVIVGRATILAGDAPPIRIMAQRSGQLLELLVKSGETVTEGQLLAVLENAAATRDVLELEEALAQSAEQPRLRPLQLGDVQPAYAEFQRRMEQVQDAERENHTVQAIKILTAQTTTLQAGIASLERQVATLNQEVTLAEKNLTIIQALFKSGGNSEADKERAEAAYLRYVRELEAKKAEILTNRLSIERIRSEQLSLQHLADERLRSEALLLRESASRLSSAIREWRQNYCLTAPISGRVVAEGAWADRQYLESGQAAFTILPTAGGIASARTWISPEGLGKIKPGATAQFRLDAFPYKQYGVLNGVVRSISPVPAANPTEQPRYLAEIDLEKNLVTTYGITLPPQQEMPATARIMTQKRSLLQRIFDQFLDAFYNRE